MKFYSTKLLQKVQAHLHKGGVIAYPTESCYGLGCDPFNYAAINKLIKIKGRSKTKGLIAIASSTNQLHKLIQPITSDQQYQLAKYWPGFYSLTLRVTAKVPRNLIGSHSKVAVRVSLHRQVKQLCDSLNTPLVSTSANKSGHHSIRNYRECQRQFGGKVLVLPGEIGKAKTPSTIIDWESQRILRQ